jgi:hypothetical protein
MNPPGFTAEACLGNSRRTYHGKYLYGGLAQNQSGLPAVVLPNQLEDMEGLDEGDEFDLMDEVEEDGGLEEEMDNGEED